jgi:hypothetical protein
LESWEDELELDRFKRNKMPNWLWYTCMAAVGLVVLTFIYTCVRCYVTFAGEESAPLLKY